MNGLLTLLGIESWKPVLTALMLPPVPFFLTLLIGARLILPRRGLGWLVILFSIVGLWLSSCFGTGRFLTQFALKPPPALSAENLAELKAATKAKQPIAVVVLGGGVEPLAPEYGVANLSAESLERLRYGLWLSREVGAPVAYSGGVGWSQTEAQAEAQAAAYVASHDFGQQLKWLEDRSRDTRENALRTIPVLKQAGITHILLVTHGWHMPRALKNFEQAAGGAIKVQAAPMGMSPRSDRPVLDWMPSSRGFESVRHALHEMLGLLAGA